MAAQLTKEQAEAAIGKVIAVLEEEATKAKLLGIVEAVNKLPAEQQQMAKMMQLMPAVQEATAPVMVEFGFPPEQGMMFMMALQQHAMISAIVKDGVAKLQDTMAGKAAALAVSAREGFACPNPKCMCKDCVSTHAAPTRSLIFQGGY